MRKGSPKKRIIHPDAKFGDVLVTKFINNLMIDGKKSTATAIFYECVELVATKTQEDGLEVWRRALANVTPTVEVKSRRVGGSTFQVPTEVSASRRVALSHRWLIGYAKSRNEKTMAQKLASEIVAASKGEGAAVKKKEDTYRMAEANKAFSHFRF
jgi:small subunit ribosomal protein S7